jgi:hypothetical protein
MGLIRLFRRANESLCARLGCSLIPSREDEVRAFCKGLSAFNYLSEIINPGG